MIGASRARNSILVLIQLDVLVFRRRLARFARARLALCSEHILQTGLAIGLEHAWEQTTDDHGLSQHSYTNSPFCL